MANNLLRDFWFFIRQDIKSIPWDQVVNIGTEALSVLDSFKEGWKKHAEKIVQLTPHLDEIKPFIELLDLPLTQLALSGLPCIQLGITLLKTYLSSQEIKPSFNNSVLLATQVAYLESLRLALAKVEDLEVFIALENISLATVFERQLTEMDSLELTRAEAHSTITEFPRSALAESFTLILEQQLKASHIPDNKIQHLTNQITWGTPRHLLFAISELKNEVQPLADFLKLGGLQSQEKYESIENYLEKYIQPLPLQPVFDEDQLTLGDLYVPLDVQLLDGNGEPLTHQMIHASGKYSKFHPISHSKEPDGQPIAPQAQRALRNIHDWVQEILEQKRPQRKVIFIEGEAGRGKSVFCSMLADWVRVNLYPSFIPILVRLRDVKQIENNLSKTLETFLEYADFVQREDHWLTNENTRFLLIFDGFDELLLEGRSSGGLKDFLQQIAQFQRHSAHQCLITGRPLALQGIDKQITQINNLERARLEPMSDDHRAQWLAHWGAKFGEQETQGLQEFLNHCPEDISNSLAREPLLLYLMARLHREGQLQTQQFQDTLENTQAKVQIYDKSINWILSGQGRNARLSGLETEDLREVLQEAALCVVQSGKEAANLRMLEVRLSDSQSEISELLKTAQTSIDQNEEKTLNNLLTSFYLRPGEKNKTGSIEFSHKSFGEFLFAERLKVTMQRWISSTRTGRSFEIPDSQFEWEIYDLLGYGALSPEIVSYLSSILLHAEAFDAEKLFKRLFLFYERWSEGEYIDNRPDLNLPQRKMLQFQTLELPIGLRQVDLYAGLNVMILLFELHRYGKLQEIQTGEKTNIVFYPYGDPESDLFDETKLRRIITYSNCVSTNAFVEIVGFALTHASLSRADLNNVHLNHADMSDADLSHAQLINAQLFKVNLTRANLIAADLTSADFYEADLTAANLKKAKLPRASFENANLTQAQLSSAHLENADFTRANLTSANLSDSDLYKANFYQANLTGANCVNANFFRVNLSEADLAGIIWNEETKWSEVKGLERAKNVPMALRQMFNVFESEGQTENGNSRHQSLYHPSG